MNSFSESFFVVQVPSHTEFYIRLREHYPDAAKIISEDDCGFGLLHVEVGTFSRLSEDALEAGMLWHARGHLDFVENLLEDCSPELENALAVSYLEHIFLFPRSPLKSKAIEQYLGKNSRKLLDKLISHMKRISGES